MWKHCLLMIALMGVSSTATGQHAVRSVASSDTKASQQALAQSKRATLRLLHRLSDASNPNWIIGQNIGHGNEDLRAGYFQFATGLTTVAGESPALLGIDLGYNEIPRRSTSAIRIVQDFQASPGGKSGLLAVSMHPRNPFRNSDCNDVRPVDWNDLLDPESIVQKRWQRTLDRVADFLLELQDSGTVVLWRPFHEMNGGWFWWCARHADDTWTSQSEFVALWKYMHWYFEYRGVENLIWVYSPAVQTDAHQRPADYYYPGDQFVDVVALDWYSDNLDDLNKYRSYERLVQLGKPMGLGEFGPKDAQDGRLDNLSLARAMRKYPHLGFAMYWHSWKDASMAIKDQENAEKLMRLDQVLTLRKLNQYPSRQASPN